MTDTELSLAAACCRWSYSGEGSDAIARISSKVDWPRFLRLIERHRVQTLVISALEGSGIRPPAEVGQAISRDSRVVAELNLRSALESARLADAFAVAGLDLLFVKGLTLSALAYGDPFLKMSSDIDILVRQDAVSKAADLLGTLGYIPTAPAVASSSPALRKWHKRRKESDWYNPDTGLKVDFHSALADNAELIPSIGMSSPRQMVRVGQWSFPTLSTDDLFAYLSVHGTWSAWYRLKWITDLAALVHRSGPGATELLYDHAMRASAGRAAGQGLLLANRLFGLELPHPIRTQIDRDPVNALLARIALRELENEHSPTERFLGTLPIHSLRPLLLPAWRFKYSEVKRQLHDVVDRVTLRA